MFSSSKTVVSLVALVACVALPACSSSTDDDGVAHAEDDLGGVPLLDFTWSTRGPIHGLHCLRIDEPAAVTRSTDRTGPGARTGVFWDERAGATRWTDAPWRDNYLCTKGDHGLRWSFAGPIEGMVCTNINEAAAPAEHTWADNYLCAPRDYRLAWSSAGPLPGHVCTQISEPNQRSWDDNFLCQDRR